MALVPVLDLRDPEGDPRDRDDTPGNIVAEQALLGVILFDNTCVERIPAALEPRHFREPFHQRLYASIQKLLLKGQLAEPIVLMEEFRNDPAFEDLGGIRYLADLIDRAPPAANAGDYARVIHDIGLRRDMIDFAAAMVDAAKNSTESAHTLLELAEQDLYSITTDRAEGGFNTFADTLSASIDHAAMAYERDGDLAGISTGLIDLDKKIGGLVAPDLLILAARPSMGKSTLAANIALNVARSYAFETSVDGHRITKAGGVVAYFSPEMSDEQLGMRFLAEVSGVPSHRIERGDFDLNEFGRIRDAAQEIIESPLFIDDTGAISIPQIRTRCRRLKRSHGLDLIIIDYLQLLTTGEKSENRAVDVSKISQGLKSIAKELHVPVVALAQLSRDVEKREDKRPQLSDLRESGSIEQDADVVMFIYREAYYLQRDEPKEGTEKHLEWMEKLDACQNISEVIIGKQRRGPIGTVKLHFNPDMSKFTNLAREGRFNPKAVGD